MTTAINREENKKKEIKTDLFSVATHDSRYCFVTSRRSPSNACRDIISDYLQDTSIEKDFGFFFADFINFFV